MRVTAAFLENDCLRRVVHAVETAGGQVRVVGGCVRDALAGRPLGDIDLATTLPPEAVMATAQAAGLKAIPTGIEHGTVTVVCERQPFEITTLRRDVKTDGRHAEVAFTTDWREDAARRDFTINALSCTLEGEVFDYFGGVDDLRAGRVRFVGNPLHRIKEDVLRILRFFRFQAYFGTEEPDGAALMGCQMLVSLLPNLSRERVRTELLKLLAAPDPVPVWRLMIRSDVFKWLELPLSNAEGLEQLVSIETKLFDQLAEDGWRQGLALRRLWAACKAKTNPQELAAALRLSNDEALRLRAMSTPLLLTGGEAGLRRLVYQHGLQAVTDQLILSGTAMPEQLKALVGWTVPVFPLRGKDLQALGLAPGPRMGELLRHIEGWWVEQDFSPDKAACLRYTHTVL